jgi:DNA replication and repair protein RecF
VKLVRVVVDGVRNLLDVDVRPHERLTVIVGPNGAGKTSLLEAIHLACALRPLRALERASDLVGFGRERGVVKATVDLDGPLEIEVVCEPRGRRATIAQKAVRDVGEIASRIGVVSFLPEDAALVRGSPDVRRRGLDRFAYSLDAGFAQIARRFEEALERRNRVLKAPVVDVALLESYDAPFVEAANALTEARARAVQAWAPAFEREARAIAGDALAASLSYAPASDPSALLEQLGAARDQELRKRTTAVGPHHDDLVILKADRRARFLASQGETRALVLALKLAQVRLVTAARDAGPLFLLDDVAGELDPDRAARLFVAVDECGAQTFVTVTHTEALPPLGDHSVIKM